MKYFKQIKLKDGRDCTLRNGVPEDGQAALDNYMLTHGETDFLLTYPEECSRTAQQEAELLRAKSESADELELVAEVDGIIVGTAGLSSLGARYKVKHRASFGISIAREYWSLGLGRAMTRACIECAAAAGYSQLELDAVSENKRAIALYRSEGFVEYGRNPRGFRSCGGGWQELVHMRLEL